MRLVLFGVLSAFVAVAETPPHEDGRAPKPAEKKESCGEQVKREFAPRPVQQPGLPPGAYAVATAPIGARLRYFPDGKSIVALTTLAQSSALYDTVRGKQIRPFVEVGKAASLQGSAISQDGKYAVHSLGDQGHHLVEVATGKLAFVLNKEKYFAMDTFMSRDGKRLLNFAPPAHGNEVTLWDVEKQTSETIPRSPGGAMTDAAVFSADGKEILSVLADNRVARYDLATKKYTMTEAKIDGRSHAVEFSPDGKQIAYSKWETIHVLDVATGKEIAKVKHPEGVTQLRFSPDGKLLLAGDTRGTARIVEVNTGATLSEYSVPNPRSFGAFDRLKEISGMDFSPDGRSIATNYTADMYLWDLRAGSKAPATKANFDALWATLGSETLAALQAKAEARCAGKEFIAYAVKKIRAAPPKKAPAGVAPLLDLVHSKPREIFAEEIKAQSAAAVKQIEAMEAEKRRPAMSELVAKLVTAMGDDEFFVRERAQNSLEYLLGMSDEGEREFVQAEIDKGQKNDDPEIRARVRRIRPNGSVLARNSLDPERLRYLRTLEIIDGDTSKEAEALRKDLNTKLGR